MLTSPAARLDLQQPDHSGVKRDGDITGSFDPTILEHDRTMTLSEHSSSQSRETPCAPEEPATVASSGDNATHIAGDHNPQPTPVLHDAGSPDLAVHPTSSQWPSSFGAAAGIHSSGRIVIPATTPSECSTPAVQEASSARPSSSPSALLSHRALNRSRQSEGPDSPLMHAAAAAAAAIAPPQQRPSPAPECSIPSSASSRSHVPVAESSNEHASDPLYAVPLPTTAEPVAPMAASPPHAIAADASADAAASAAPAVGRYHQPHPNFQDGILRDRSEIEAADVMAACGEAAPTRSLPFDIEGPGGIEGHEFGGALAAAAASSSSDDSDAVMHVRPCTPAPELPDSSPSGSGDSGATSPMITQEPPCDDPAAHVHACACIPGGGAAADGAAQHAGGMHARSAAAQHSGSGPDMPTEWPSVQGPPNRAAPEHSACRHARIRPSHSGQQESGFAYGLRDQPSGQRRVDSGVDCLNMHQEFHGSRSALGPAVLLPGQSEPGCDQGHPLPTAATAHGHLAPRHGGGSPALTDPPAELQTRRMAGVEGVQSSEGAHPEWASDAGLACSSAVRAAQHGQRAGAWAHGSGIAPGEARHAGGGAPALVTHPQATPTHAAPNARTTPAPNPRTDTGRFRSETPGRSEVQHQTRRWTSEDTRFSPHSAQRTQHVRGAQHAAVEPNVVWTQQAPVRGGARRSCNGREATSAAAPPDRELLQQRVVALEAVVQIQEEQLLTATALGAAAARPEVVTLLPRWREEALRQYEQRLHAQLAAKEARAECEQQRAAARVEVNAAHNSVAVAEAGAREAQLQSRLSREQARAAAAAEAAARALAHDADGRAAAAAQEARRMHDAVATCMEGMRASESILGMAMDKAASHLLRIEFAGERLTFATKLWAAKASGHLRHACPSPDCASSAGSDPRSRPLLLHAPPATTPPCGTHHACTASGQDAVAGAVLPRGSETGQLMHREVVTLRQDRDALVGSITKLRATIVQQVHSRESAAAAAGREVAEAEAEGRRRDEQWREGAARAAEERLLRGALRRAVVDAERQVLATQGVLSERLAQLEPRLWAAEDRAACVSRQLERERHDSRLTRDLLRRKAHTIQDLQGECSRWQAAAAEAAAAAAAAEHGRADASAEGARARHAAAEAAADIARSRRVQVELEEEVARLRAEVEDARDAVEQWERSAAEAEAAAAEEAEDWEREVLELREEVQKWQDAAAEAAEGARSAASQQVQAEASARTAELEAEQACAALKRTHADVLAGLRQRHEEAVQRLERELEGRGREVQSARRERNALLSALRDADRRAANSAGGAAGGALAHPASGGVIHSDVEAPTHGSTPSRPVAIRHLGAAFPDADDAAAPGSMRASLAAVPAHEVGLGNCLSSPQRSPLVATSNVTKAGGAAHGGAADKAAMRGRHARRDMRLVEQVPRDVKPVRSSSHLGKRARQDSSVTSDEPDARGCVPVANQGETPPCRLGAGSLTEGPSDPRIIPWLQGAGGGRPRVSTHGDEACTEAGRPWAPRCDYGDWEDSDADATVHNVHELPPHRDQGRPPAAPDHSSGSPVSPHAQRAALASCLHATTRGTAVRTAGAARMPHDHAQQKSPGDGSGGGPSSDSEAEEDARMLRRAAHAAGVPLDLVVPGGYRCSAPEVAPAAPPAAHAPRQATLPHPHAPAPVPLTGAGDVNGASEVDGCAPQMRHGGPSQELPLADSASSGSARGRALPRSMAQAAGAWPALHAANADLAQRVRAGRHAHALRRPEWEAPGNTSASAQPPAALEPPGSSEKAHMHEGAWQGGRVPSQIGAPAALSDCIAVSSDWVSIADSAHVLRTATQHAQHAPRSIEHAFRITHHQPQGSVAAHAQARVAMRAGNGWLIHEEQACPRPPPHTAAVAEGKWLEAAATVAAAGQGTAPPAGPSEAVAAAASGCGVAGDAAGWQRSQPAGAGTLWKADTQPPWVGGGTENHHSTLRDRFQVFSRPDCSFLEFHNQIYDSTHGEDSARDAGSGLLSAMHHRNGNPGIGAAHRSHSDRGYSGLDERALMPHTTLPSAPGAASGMATPFSSPPLPPRRSSGASPSARSSPAATSDHPGHPRRPESIFDELSAPSLRDESSMHACAVATSLPSPVHDPPAQHCAPASAPKPALPAPNSHMADLTAELPQRAAQHSPPASAVSVLSLIPPNDATATQKRLERSEDETPESPVPPLEHGPACMAKAECGAGMRDMGNVFELALGARSTSSHLSHVSACRPTSSAAFPLMCSQQVQSSELPVGLTVARKLAKAAAVSATAAAARASRESSNLEDLALASPEDTSPPTHMPTSRHDISEAHLGTSCLHSSADEHGRGGGSGNCMHVCSSPAAPTGGAGVHALQGLRGAAAVPPRTPLATGAARMLALRQAVEDHSGTSPQPHDTSRDVSLAAAARPAGAGARRSLPFSDRDFASRSALSLETSEEGAGAAEQPDAARTPDGPPALGTSADSTADHVQAMRSTHSEEVYAPVPCSAAADGRAAQPVHGSDTHAWAEAPVDSVDGAVAAPAIKPHTQRRSPVLGLDPAVQAASGRSCRRGAIAGGMHDGGEGSGGRGAMAAPAADTPGSKGAGDLEERRGREGACGSDGAPEDVLQSRLHALDGDLRRITARLRTSWDSARGAGGTPDGSHGSRAAPRRHGGDTLPGHGSRPADVPCAAPDESSAATAAVHGRGAEDTRPVATGNGVTEVEEHELPCTDATQRFPESAVDPVLEPTHASLTLGYDSVPGGSCAESHALLRPFSVVAEAPLHAVRLTHAEDQTAAAGPRSSARTAADRSLGMHPQVPASLLDEPSRSAVREPGEVAAAGSSSAGDTTSPGVKAEWETHCRGLSLRRRR